MTIPNLFIIGATKCGTTSLHNYLDAHPAVVMSSTKEPGFFLAPEGRHPVIQANGSSEQAHLEAYRALFQEKAGSIQYFGESSTAYTHLPDRSGVAERIYKFNPMARLIYVVRDPIERTISHYWWNVRWEEEQRSLDNAVTEESVYLAVSNYVMQLEEYYRYFEPASIYVMTLEELSAKPLETMEQLLQWLGLDSTDAQDLLQTRKNVTPETVPRTRSTLLKKLRYSPAWNQIGPNIPKPLRTLARRFAETKVDRAKIDTKEIEDWLRPRQQVETEELSQLLGRSFDDWKTLWNGSTRAVRTQS